MFYAAARRLRSSAPATRINLALAALLWSYTLVRAARLSFTHDESLTYLIAVKASYADIAHYQLSLPSNNHLLNSVLAKLGTVFGTSPFVLRLPNVLAHAGYLVSALLLSRRVTSTFLSVLSFLVLTLHPFMLDFFSMCRGYGLACGFELMALCVLVSVADDARIRPTRTCAAMLLAALSPLSNLSFLVFFLAFTGILVLSELTKWWKGRPSPERSAGARGTALLASLGLACMIAALLCAWVVPIGLKLRALGELYYGGDQGFLADTLGSLLEASTYYKPYPLLLRPALQALGALLLAASLLLAGRLALQGLLTALWLCALPLLTALICVVQHAAMDTKFPVDRTALFFLPMFGLALVGASSAAVSRGSRYALLGCAALLLVVNAARSLNRTYFAQWKYDASTARMLDRLGSARRGQRRVHLGATWLFEPSIAYYREQRGLHWLARVSRGSIHDDLDYYYYLPEDAPIMAQRKLLPIQRFKVSEATLARQLPP